MQPLAPVAEWIATVLQVMLVVPSCLPTVIPSVAPGVTVKYFSLRPPPDPAAEQQLPIDIHLGIN